MISPISKFTHSPIPEFIKVQKTARYYTLGELNENTKSVWFVVHGYGELAEKFIQQFEPLAQEGNFIIAPEALSRFYWKGFGGKPVASWMTSEDRENEISDYIAYLDTLKTAVLNDFPAIEINLLGFSQGVATVCRWFAYSDFEINQLWLFGSVLPHDSEYEKLQAKFSNVNLTLAIGKSDPFYNEERKQQGLALMKNSGVAYNFIEFEGGHEVNLDLVI